MELNFKSFGEGEPVLIIHGLFGMLDNWQTFARKLSDEFQVFIIDLPNHGRSPELFPVNYPIMSEVLKEFMESQWLHSAHIIGHSMGGKVGMQLALDHPEFVSKLVVVDIAPTAYNGGHEEILSAMEGLSPDELNNRSEAKKSLIGKLKHEAVVDFLMKNLSRTRTGGYQWKFSLENLKRAYTDILQPIHSDNEYEGPVLFVKGGSSQYINNEHLEVINRYFPEYRLETIENAGHWVHADQPEALLHLIRTFLR
jgi:pimeloyl-ACP methyl ester carboxylesterase